MDEQELQKNIALYYSKLPPKVQEIFSSMKWLETLKEISSKYKLNNAQQEILATETTLVLLGIIHLDEYQKNLWTELNLSEESMDSIFLEINNSIINNIRPELFQVFETNVKSGAIDEPEWQQNINFILSGGDYGAFLVPTQVGIPTEVGKQEETVLPVFSVKKD